ncbi:acylglycerone-phosphate reductase [Ascoidea rubescens DSM 1968]|uniref:NAD(P)-binding protein n=1 Tax=Ascoidea rubescens DSM 1968 TaxID=1344418 RepID=A0A1D2VHU4_9ASCO|nr:NAD(P)-binding protein [Ascoidea rubescens DSM 1968]ODV61179.1 NAD(P)-binding protein [Ascoidea rubescens DSM 1968]
MSGNNGQKTALITGASSGIGFAVSKELNKRGYKVFACARRLEAMKELEELGIRTISCDVTKQEDVLKMKEIVEKEVKGEQDNNNDNVGLDILYNNAGQSCTFPSFEVSDEAAKQCFEVNVLAPIRITREFSKLIIQKKGIIIFTGSLAGITPFPWGSVYGASKAAIHQYAAILHIEMKGLGVRVLNVVTGGVLSNIDDKRPLPEDSMFNFKEGIESIEGRKTMAKNNQPLSAEEYARRVCNDIEKNTYQLNTYRGKFSSILRFAMGWVPRSIMEFILLKKFMLFPIFKVLNSQKEHKFKRT